MKNIRFVLSENVTFLVVKFSMYLKRPVFVMFSDSNIDSSFTVTDSNNFGVTRKFFR